MAVRKLLFALATASALPCLSCDLAEMPRHSFVAPSAATLAGPAAESSHEDYAVATPAPPAMHTGTVVPAKHPDRTTCAPFQESTNATCVTGFLGPMVVTDVDFGSDCEDELIVMAVSIAPAARVDVGHPHWYLENPARSHLSIHSAEFSVEATDELVFAARPTNGAATPASGSSCFITWSSRGPANPASVYPRLE